MHYAFVYGTLKQGGRFDTPDLQHARKFVHPGRIYGFTLWDLGSFPSVQHTGYANDCVQGEVHGYNSEDWDAVQYVMDMIEGFKPKAPTEGLYNKMIVPIQTSLYEVDATVYYANNMEQNWPEAKQVKGGVWEI